MIKCTIIASVTLVCLSVHAAPPRKDQALIQEIEAFATAIPKVLAHAHASPENEVQIVTNHSKWAHELAERSEVFIGTGSALERSGSPFIACHKAAYWAREMWQDTRAYDGNPNKANYVGMTQFTGHYKQAMRDCKAASSKGS